MGRYKERHPLGLGSCWAARLVARAENPKCDGNKHLFHSKGGVLRPFGFITNYIIAHLRIKLSFFFIFIPLSKSK